MIVSKNKKCDTLTQNLNGTIAYLFFDLRLQGSKKFYFLRLVTCDLIKILSQTTNYKTKEVR